jgi:S1-C subfamily serine protease
MIAIPPAGLLKIPDLVEQIRPAVIHVQFEREDGGGNGSGFMIEPLPKDPAEGIVVTNAHVAKGASRLTVRLLDGYEAEAAVRVCDDSTDLALLSIGVSAGRELELRPLASVRVGEPVIAVGSPYGMEGTVTAGIVSGLDRTMPAPNRVPIENMIQTDALINPGNSGGPLIGADGRVIGVNDQTIIGPETGASGLGFAIPSDTVRLVYEEIIETGNAFVIRATIAMRTTLRPFSYEERKRFGQKAGAVVVSVPGAEGPAAAAGIRKGDIVVSFNGRLVEEPGALYSELNRKVIGVPCVIEYIRDRARHSGSVVPKQRPVRSTKEN